MRRCRSTGRRERFARLRSSAAGSAALRRHRRRVGLSRGIRFRRGWQTWARKIGPRGARGKVGKPIGRDLLKATGQVVAQLVDTVDKPVDEPWMTGGQH